MWRGFMLSEAKLCFGHTWQWWGWENIWVINIFFTSFKAKICIILCWKWQREDDAARTTQAWFKLFWPFNWKAVFPFYVRLHWSLCHSRRAHLHHLVKSKLSQNHELLSFYFILFLSGCFNDEVHLKTSRSVHSSAILVNI